MMKQTQGLRGRKPSRLPNGSILPLFKYSSGGCPGFEPGSLFIDAAYSMSNRIPIQLVIIIQDRLTKINLSRKSFEKSYSLKMLSYSAAFALMFSVLPTVQYAQSG